MKAMIIKNLLCLITLFLWAPSSYGGVMVPRCQDVLLSSTNPSPRSQKILQRALDLDKDLYIQLLPLSLESEPLMPFYLVIKEKAWDLSPDGQWPWRNWKFLSYQQTQHLKKSFGDQYDLESLDPEKTLLFYHNQLQGLYQSAFRFWKTEWLETLDLSMVSREQRLVLDKTLEVLWGADGTEAGLAPERVQTLVKQYRDNQVLVFNFFKFLLAHGNHWNNLDGMQWESFPLFLRDAFLTAHRQPKMRELCCKNGSGCWFCPHNRGFLKKTGD